MVKPAVEVLKKGLEGYKERRYFHKYPVPTSRPVLLSKPIESPVVDMEIKEYRFQKPGILEK